VGSTYVVCNTSSDAALQAYCDDLHTTPTNFNGDDTRVLQCSGIVVDTIGQIGFDPGTEWGTAPLSTLNYTLRRDTQIIAGDADPTDAFDPTIEWISFAQDTFDGLGWH
jgi:hypothetical protein